MASSTETRRPEAGGSATGPAPRRFTVEEYYRMAEVGILRDDERVELVEGAIIQMSPIGSRHAGGVRSLTDWAYAHLHGRVIVSVQSPVRLGPGSEPEPDITLLRPRADRYADAHPGPEDVLLLIEVSDTSLRYDREVKLPLYAAAGIPEVWLFDVVRRRIFVFREPRDGSYQVTMTVDRSGTVSPMAFPDLSLAVSDLFA